MRRHVGFHYINHPKHLFFTLAFIIGGVFGIAYSIRAYPETFKTIVRMDKSINIAPDDEIVVYFSNPVFENTFSDIQVFNNSLSSNHPEKINFMWRNSNRELVIVPENSWKLESRYRINIPSGENKMFVKVEPASLEFSTISFPKVVDIVPSNGEKDVILGIEDPITVNFEKSAENFSIKMVLNPESSLTYQANLEKTRYKFLPSEKIKEGKYYKIMVLAKYIKDSDDKYKEIFSSSFTTKAPPPQNWEKDFTLRLEQAKNFTVPQIISGKYIDINLTQQILCIFEEGNLLDCYLVSTGKRGMETSKGKFAIKNKASRVWSKKYSLYMPYWMAVAPDGSFGIHELPEWPGGYKEGTNHLGTPVSHGCIRLGVGPAKRVFDWTDIGTPVIIY